MNMANDIPGPVISVSIPTFTITSVSGADEPKLAAFTGGSPPLDGSLALAFINLGGGLRWAGEIVDGGNRQRLAFFRGTDIEDPPAIGGVAFLHAEGPIYVTGWSFVGIDSVPI
jgi:hypothetical protein